MNLGEMTERTVPAVIAVGLTFGLQAWNQSRIDEMARVQSVASEAWVQKQIAPTRDLAESNQRTNIRQDQLWARICERQGMQCNLRDAVLRVPGDPPIPSPGYAVLPVVHDKRERERRGVL
tara:strand:- start:387 stop:749 length:363 start_codon:yes stop_codon:yes gene_type:complete